MTDPNVWEVFDVTSELRDRSVKVLTRRLDYFRQEDGRPMDEALILKIRFARALQNRYDGNWAAAKEEYEDILDITKRSLGPLHEDTVNILKEFADMLVSRECRLDDRFAYADMMARSFVLSLGDKNVPRTSDAVAIVNLAMGLVLVGTSSHNNKVEWTHNERGLLAAGLGLLREAIPFLKEAQQGLAHHWHLGKDILGALTALVVAYGRLGRASEALEIQREVLARTREKYLNTTNGNLSSAMTLCASLYATNEKYVESEELFRECLDRQMRDKEVNMQSEKALGVTVRAFGQLLEHLGRNYEARDLGLQHFDRLKDSGSISLACVPSFRPKEAFWLPKP